MLKKYFGIFVVLVFAISLFGCGGGTKDRFAGPTISKVTATITASDFDPIIVNLTNDNGIWKGTAIVRVGKNREIKVKYMTRIML
jgi:hypothetical protein